MPPATKYQVHDDQEHNKLLSGSGGEYGARPSSGEARFEYKVNEWRDKWWALLFVLHLGAIAALGGMWGGDLIAYLRAQEGKATPKPTGTPAVDINHKQFFIGVAAAIGAGAVASLMWLHICKKYAESIIKISMVMNCVFLGTAALASVLAGAPGGAIMALLVLGLTLLYFYWVRDRIPFTQAMLHASTTSIQSHGGTVGVAFFMVFLQVVWVVAWTFVTGATYYHLNKDAVNKGEQAQIGGAQSAGYFLLLVSLFWTSQVLKNVGHVTTCGVVGWWWLNPGAEGVTASALKRALTTSFGSICLGSLIVAILKAVVAVLRSARDSARDNNNAAAACILCCVECMVDCVERMIEFFNFYAYTRVAIYGEDFTTAASKTWNAFKTSGFTLIINADLTGMVLVMGCFVGAVISGATGGAVAWLMSPHEGSTAWAVAVFGMVVGFLMVALVMSVVESAVATTFVLWAEDPNALAETRGEEFAKIREASRALPSNYQINQGYN